MKLNAIILTLFALLPVTAPAQTADYSEFRIISQRNIFNLNRVPARTNQTVAVQAPAQGFVEAFSLVGTMTYEKGQFAFFDGTRPDYQKAIKPAETIGGYKLVAVLPTSVRLETRGAEFEMKVGTELRRDEKTARFYADGLGVTGYTNASTATTNVVSALSAGSPSPEASDILKRLMQKREQELK